ncbi:MAG: YhcH/YjgK/YiaL family protein [Flavisolibacter sp.]
MYRKILLLFVLACFVTTIPFANEISPRNPTKHQAKKWFKKQEWLKGLQLKPSNSVNYIEFYRQYHANQSYWDKAFDYLKTQNLQTLSVGRHDIDGENVYASVTENPTKDFDSTTWESHRQYIDLQYVIAGKEEIGVASPQKLTVVKPYDAKRDVANYSGKGKLYHARPGTFFLFFPSDAHRPNIADGDKEADKKIVIKIRYVD